MKATVSVDPGTGLVRLLELRRRRYEHRSPRPRRRRLPRRLGGALRMVHEACTSGIRLSDLAVDRAPRGLTARPRGDGREPNVQDVFVQLDYLVGDAHSHLPSRAALDSVAVLCTTRRRGRTSLPAGSAPPVRHGANARSMCTSTLARIIRGHRRRARHHARRPPRGHRNARSCARASREAATRFQKPSAGQTARLRRSGVRLCGP